MKQAEKDQCKNTGQKKIKILLEYFVRDVLRVLLNRPYIFIANVTTTQWPATL